MKYALLLAILSSTVFATSDLQKVLDKKRSESKAPKKIREQMDRAILDLKKSRIEEKSLQKGRKVPEFRIGKKSIKEYYKNNYLIIKFYRGHWCPYCMIELKEYEKFYPEFQKKGAKLIALVPDSNKEIAKTRKKFNLTFPIFRDENNKIAKKFGIAFGLEDGLVEIYKSFGIKLSESQGNNNNELPMPGTYLINKNGYIVYAFADADYTKRLDPRILLKKFP